MRKNRTVLLISFFICCGFVFFLNVTPGLAQSNIDAKNDTLSSQSESLPPNVADGGNKFIDPRVLTPVGMSQEDVTRRPFLYWRAYANQRIPFMRLFPVLLFVTTILNFALEKKIREASEFYRKKWLRSFGVGVLFFTIGLIGAGMMYRMALFSPVSTGLVITVQVLALLGLTVAAYSLGDAALKISRVENNLKNVWFKSFARVLSGSLTLSLLALLPGAGPIPPMGIRMLALIAAAGGGALLLVLKQDRTQA